MGNWHWPTDRKGAASVVLNHDVVRVLEVAQAMLEREHRFAASAGVVVGPAGVDEEVKALEVELAKWRPPTGGGSP